MHYTCPEELFASFSWSFSNSTSDYQRKNLLAGSSKLHSTSKMTFDGFRFCQTRTCSLLAGNFRRKRVYILREWVSFRNIFRRILREWVSFRNIFRRPRNQKSFSIRLSWWFFSKVFKLKLLVFLGLSNVVSTTAFLEFCWISGMIYFVLLHGRFELSLETRLVARAPNVFLGSFCSNPGHCVVLRTINRLTWYKLVGAFNVSFFIQILWKLLTLLAFTGNHQINT